MSHVYLVFTADLVNDPDADVDSVWDNREAADLRATNLKHSFVVTMTLNQPEGYVLDDPAPPASTAT